MSFNTFIRVCGGLATGRSIGGGRDKSGPTSVTYSFTRPWVFRYSSSMGWVPDPVYLDVDCRLTIRKCDMFATRMRHFPVPAWCTNTLDTQRYEIGECCQRSDIEANW